VDSITFEGISGGLTFPHERLKDVLTLRAGSYYNPDALNADIETLTEFYHALGYLYVEVQEPDIKITDSRAEIKFYIKEGHQVRLSSISIKNNRHIKEEDILREIQLKQGSPYNEVDISDARRKILEIYNKQGFLDTAVAVEREISGTAANITFDIQEGEVTLFGKAIIIGNEQTKYHVINREFLHKEDSPLNYNLVLQERHRLYRLGLFADVEAKLSDKVGDKRDVFYRLKEADAGAVEFGFGYGEYERFRGFFDINYKTFLRNEAFYKEIISRLPPHTPDIGASVLLISGCQDHQKSLDGWEFGRFTEKMLDIWNNGKFDGDYQEFHQKIRRKMPRSQQPNFMAVGQPHDLFLSQKPFQISLE